MPWFVHIYLFSFLSQHETSAAKQNYSKKGKDVNLIQACKNAQNDPHKQLKILGMYVKKCFYSSGKVLERFWNRNVKMNKKTFLS